MCELLGMSANVPTDICFSFSGLMQRGGKTGPHADGWGISFYEGRGCRSFHDPCASAESKIAQLIRQYPIKSRVVVSHIRRANRGRVALENTHPFQRELNGRIWVFAHNGQLKGIKRRPLAYHRPVGTTDSEYAFCWMMDRLRSELSLKATPGAVCKQLQRLGDELANLGVMNFLISDGRFLFARCHTQLAWITRRAPFGAAKLADMDFVVDFSKETTPKDVVTVIATRPLTTNEEWQIMQPGECVAFRDGEPIFQHA